MKFVLTVTAVWLATATAQAQVEMEARGDVLAAKKRFDVGLAEFKDRVRSEFKAREEKIRQAKNGLALLKVHATEKEYFDDAGDLPLWMPSSVYAEKERLVRDYEGAYLSAIRTLTKAREDRAAERLQAELQRFWEKRFDKVDYKAASIKDGAIHLPPRTDISTTDEYTGPVEVLVVARTARENIRLLGYGGSCVIFNWEVKPKELRVHWPDADKPVGESISTAAVTPLTPGKFYRLRWLIGPTGMTLLVNEQKVFVEARSLAVDKMKGKFGVRSCDHDVDVTELRVRRLVVEP
jgi:hypothetical protein